MIDETSRSPVGFCIVAGEVVDSDAAGFSARRVDELAIPDIHPDVGDTRSRGVEEDQVSRLQIAGRDCFARVELLRRRSWQIDSFAAIDILCETRTVERAGTRRAKTIRSSSVSVCRPDNLIGRRRSLRLGSNSICGVGGGSVVVLRRLFRFVCGDILRFVTVLLVGLSDRVRLGMLPTRCLVRPSAVRLVRDFRDPVLSCGARASSGVMRCKRTLRVMMSFASASCAIVVVRD